MALEALCSLISGVAVGSGWQSKAAFVNMGSYYFVGIPIGVFLGWFLSFGIMVCIGSAFCCLLELQSKRKCSLLWFSLSIPLMLK